MFGLWRESSIKASADFICKFGITLQILYGLTFSKVLLRKISVDLILSFQLIRVIKLDHGSSFPLQSCLSEPKRKRSPELNVPGQSPSYDKTSAKLMCLTISNYIHYEKDIVLQDHLQKLKQVGLNDHYSLIKLLSALVLKLL